MSLRRLLVASSLACLPLTATSGTWERPLGGSAPEMARDVLATRDGGYLLVGVTSSAGAGGQDAWLVKLDQNGTIAWQRVVGGPDDEDPRAVIQVGNAYAIAGSREMPGRGNDGWLLVVGLDGVPLLQATYGGPDHDSFESLARAPDAGYLLVGTTASDAWLVRVAPGGGVAWDVATGTSGHDSAFDVVTDPNGGYRACGVVGPDPELSGALLMTIGDDGTWGLRRRYGRDPSRFSARRLQLDCQGNAILVGAVNGSAWAASAMAGTGNLAWQWQYDGATFGSARDMTATNDHGLVVAGGLFWPSSAALLRLDSGGGLSWARTYGAGEARGVAPTPDGGFAFVRTSGTYPNLDLVAARVDGAGRATACPSGPATLAAVATAAVLQAPGLVDRTTGFQASIAPIPSSPWNPTAAECDDERATVPWALTFGASGVEERLSRTPLAPNADGRIGVGFTRLGSAGVLLLHADGSVMDQNWLPSDLARIRDLDATPDGGFVGCGLMNNGSDAYVVKLSSSMTPEWIRLYAGVNNEELLAITPTRDGYAAVGFSNSGDLTTTAWTLALDHEGGVLWQWTHGGNGEGVADVEVSPRGDVWVVGNRTAISPSLPFVLVFSRTGSVLAAGDLEASIGMQVHDVEILSDCRALLAGSVDGPGPSGWREAAIVEMTLDPATSGLSATMRTYGSTTHHETARFVRRTPAGGLFLGGQRCVGFTTSCRLFALHEDASGNVTWQRDYGEAGSFTASGWAGEVGPLGTLVAATTRDVGGELDLRVYATDANGTVGPGCALDGPLALARATVPVVVTPSTLNGTTPPNTASPLLQWGDPAFLPSTVCR